MKQGGSISGVVSLVMIFCVLCLSVFSVLTLATADRERRLSELTAEQAAAYYEADRQATEIAAALQAGRTVTGDIDFLATAEGRIAVFSLPAGGQQRLEVRLLLTDAGCEIQRWATVYSGDWTPDDTIQVWGGESYGTH